MRAFKKYSRSGFTLVELMIVVAIIGVLAALAIYGVRRYLQSAKTSEAKNGIGAIIRGAVGAFERESTVNEIVTSGASTAFAHDICSSARPAPGVFPRGTKVTPDSTPGEDFESGGAQGGWKCLKYTITNPVYYQYGYAGQRVTTGQDDNPDSALTYVTGAGASDDPTNASADFIAWAHGDLDGDSSESTFSKNGVVLTDTNTIITSTQLFVSQEYE